jgi:hypothetical protein
MKIGNWKQGSGISVFVLALLIIMGVRELVYGEGITVGEEVVLKAPGSPGGIRRKNPAVAFGKDSYLVIWQEGWNGEGGNSRIHALRVGLDGKPVDTKPLELAPCKTGVQENPRIAFFKDTFLVVWQDLRNGKDCDVLGTRVSADGKLLDKQPIAIAAAPRSQAMPDVAADDKGFMAVWHGFPGNDFQAKLYTRRIGADGAPGETLLLTVGASPRISWNGKEHLVLYFRAYNPWGAVGICSYVDLKRMDTAGKILPSRRIFKDRILNVGAQRSICGLPKGQGWVIVTHGGTPNYWGRSKGGQCVAKVTPEGQISIPPRIKIYDPKRTPKIIIPDNVLETSVGKKVQSSVAQAYVASIWPYGRSAVATDGQYCVAVWQRFYPGDATGLALINGDIRASRVDGWKVLDKDGGVPVAESKAEELDPALAGNGAGKLLCVYEKRENGRSGICARNIKTK